eukprot:7621258-Pyramimonas_sp.AAC.1
MLCRRCDHSAAASAASAARAALAARRPRLLLLLGARDWQARSSGSLLGQLPWPPGSSVEAELAVAEGLE